MFNKSGKEATIGGLVFLIAVFIVLYTLVLPPCDKCRLLEDDCTEECKGEMGGMVLLDVNPGTIGELSDESIKHDLGSVNLFIRDEPEINTLANTLEIKNGLFGESDQKLEFNINELDSIEKATLSFAVLKSKGNLIVTLNEKQIYNSKINVNKIETIDIPKEYLEENNQIRLQVSPPGISFWSNNIYYLKDVKLKENFEIEHSSDVLRFSVSSSEMESIDKSKLDYYVYCKGNPGTNDILKIYLNNHVISTEYLPCLNDDYSKEIDEDYFISGVNELEFSVSGGSYLISDVEINNDISGEVYPSYVFYIRNEVYESADNYYLDLDMRSGRKIADVIINDEIIKLDSTNSFVEYDLSKMIKKGNNYIEIKPVNEFKIDELKVIYE